MSLEDRVKKLEKKLARHKVSFNTLSGERIEVTVEELLDCVDPALKGEYHPLISKVRQADLSSYSGGGTLLELVKVFLDSPGV